MAKKKKIVVRRGKSRGGVMGSAIPLAIGGAGLYGMQALVKSVPQINEYWYGPAAVLAVGGHFLKNKHHDAGVALLALAGGFGAMAFQAHQTLQNQGGSGSGSGTSGWPMGDSGAFVRPFNGAMAGMGPIDSRAFDSPRLSSGDAGAFVPAAFARRGTMSSLSRGAGALVAPVTESGAFVNAANIRRWGNETGLIVPPIYGDSGGLGGADLG